MSLVEFIKQIRLIPQRLALVVKERRQAASQKDQEAERLDRIRNPSKYLGK
jgi:hypothetical protein